MLIEATMLLKALVNPLIAYLEDDILFTDADFFLKLRYSTALWRSVFIDAQPY